MKYIKLFESFDRYEFGEYKGDYDNLELIQLYNDLKVDVIDFNTEDRTKLSDIIGHNNSLITTTIAGRTYRFIKRYGGEFVHYEIYSLGDYCYAVIGIMEMEEMGEMPYKIVTYYEIFDGFESLYEKVKSIIVS